ncbi:hypothetical protein [Fodinibius saliphilus]|uniref:hypothetical protein n=1 Tax=Fodinibius saliphilus TaxID=1920650 RepID=UPI0011093E9A|nr:hypothetical protein [Fodinibius saliphilus]
MRAFKIIGIGIFFFCHSLSFAQYSFDVKTDLDEKQDLQVLKQAVKKSIEEANWASNQEMGEDFSLWLTSINRKHEGDSLTVSIIVHLRTKAMFTKGDFIAGRKITWQYNWEKAMQFAADSLSESLLTLENSPNSDQVVDKMTSMFSSISMVTGTPLPTQMSGAFISDMTNIVRMVFKRDPSPVEVLENIYLSHLVLKATKNMIKQ